MVHNTQQFDSLSILSFYSPDNVVAQILSFEIHTEKKKKKSFTKDSANIHCNQFSYLVSCPPWEVFDFDIILEIYGKYRAIVTMWQVVLTI